MGLIKIEGWLAECDKCACYTMDSGESIFDLPTTLMGLFGAITKNDWSISREHGLLCPDCSTKVIREAMAKKGQQGDGA